MARDFASAVVDLGPARMLSGAVDPSAGAGVAAPEGSIYLLNAPGAGQLWIKAGAADTDWIAAGSGGGGGGWETLSAVNPTGASSFDFPVALSQDDEIYRIIGTYRGDSTGADLTSTKMRINGVTRDAAPFRSWANYVATTSSTWSVSAADGLWLSSKAHASVNSYLIETFIKARPRVNRPRIAMTRTLMVRTVSTRYTSLVNGIIPSSFQDEIVSLGIKPLFTFSTDAYFYLQRILPP